VGTVVELPRSRDNRLFDDHRLALAELVCAFTMHSVGGEEDFGATLTRLEDAEREFVRAWTAMVGE
jgi:hypothetical protein